MSDEVSQSRIGHDVADGRGRTGLHETGRDLDRNPRVVVRDVEVTSDGWHVLRRTTLDYQRADGRWETVSRETYDRGNGAVILPYRVGAGRSDRGDHTSSHGSNDDSIDDLENVSGDDELDQLDVAGQLTVLLVRQFRFPAYVNDHPDGMLIEAAAGLLDEHDPETAIRKEALEELGLELGPIEHVFDVYMSPGSVTERLHFYLAEYSNADRVASGGGLVEEGEDIEVLELPLAEALAMITDGRIVDGKTIMLLQHLALQHVR